MPTQNQLTEEEGEKMKPNYYYITTPEERAAERVYNIVERREKMCSLRTAAEREAVQDAIRKELKGERV